MESGSPLRLVDLEEARAESPLGWMYFLAPENVDSGSFKAFSQPYRHVEPALKGDAFREARSLSIEVVGMQPVADEYGGVRAAVLVAGFWRIERVRVFERPNPEYPELRFSALYPAWLTEGGMAFLPGGMVLLRRIKSAAIRAWKPDDLEVQRLHEDVWAASVQHGK